MVTGKMGTALRGAAQNIGVAVIYGLLFCLVWQHSIDQWYLPAGLRFAALLVIPGRRWPGLFVGEFVALFLLRRYMVEYFGMDWLLVASAVLFPVTAAVVWILKHVGTPVEAPRWHESARLVGGAVAAATGSKLAVVACIFWLAVPFVQAHAPDSVPGLIAHYSRLPAFVLGDLLGILLVAPAALLWVQRKAMGPWPAMGWSTAWTVPAFAALFVATYSLAAEWRQAACYLLFVPAAALTISLGWRGAAIGTFAANFGVALAMHRQNANGASDPTMLGVQTVLAVFSMSLLGLGAALTHHLDNAKSQRASADRANEEAKRTLDLARVSLQQAEQDMHDRAKQVAAGHASWMRLSRSMIDKVRKVDPAGAMELTYTAALEARTFHGQILESLYPLKLETESLYTVLRSSTTIAALQDTGIQVKWRLLGNSSILSDDLKRMLYRAVIASVNSFAKADPTVIHVYVRCGAARIRQGGAVVVRADGTREMNEIEPLGLSALHHRIQIYGGSMRQHRDRVTVLLTERSYLRAARAA